LQLTVRVFGVSRQEHNVDKVEEAAPLYSDVNCAHAVEAAWTFLFETRICLDTAGAIARAAFVSHEQFAVREESITLPSIAGGGVTRDLL